MRTSTPKRVTWWIALVLAAVGLIVNFVSVPFLSQLSFWLVLASAVLLLIATRIRAI